MTILVKNQSPPCFELFTLPAKISYIFKTTVNLILNYFIPFYYSNALPTQSNRKTPPLRNGETNQLARYLGFTITNDTLKSKPIYTNGTCFIVQDIDSHIGGTWKMAKSASKLTSKQTRMGTYDALLTRIGGVRSIKYNWRITKYNPEYRNNHDQFMKEDWTSFSDIGKPFNGEILTFNDYIKIESKYVNTVSFFISYLEIPYLKVTHLEKYIHNELELEHKHYQFPYFKHTSDQETFITTIKDETIVDEKQTRQLCRYILRDHLWCKLEYNDLFFVHFGFDFYMYIGCNIDCTPLIKEILTDTSLYIENCISPYID